MAGNRRGKLKEQTEGIHRDCELIRGHVSKALELIAGDNPKLTEGFTAIAECVDILDSTAQGIYSTL